MQVGIVGTGIMGTMHAESWSQAEAVIAGFLSEPPEDSQRIAGQYHALVYPTLGGYKSLEIILAACHSVEQNRQIQLPLGGHQ
jgi:predicted dehydrogenase